MIPIETSKGQIITVAVRIEVIIFRRFSLGFGPSPNTGLSRPETSERPAASLRRPLSPPPLLPPLPLLLLPPLLARPVSIIARFGSRRRRFQKFVRLRLGKYFLLLLRRRRQKRRLRFEVRGDGVVYDGEVGGEAGVGEPLRDV